MEQNQNTSLFDIQIDQSAKVHLTEAAKWAKFLAVFGFICCGFIVLVGIFFGTFISMFSSWYGENNPYSQLPVSSPGFGAGMAVLYILIALIYFFPCLFLFRFATKMKAAITANDQQVLNVSFQNLKAAIRFVGILTIIMLAFWLLAIIVGLLGNAAGSNM